MKTIVGSRILLVGLMLLSGAAVSQEAAKQVFQASGVKVGEVDSNSAIIWARTTRSQTADFHRIPILTEGLPLNAKNLKDRMPTDVVVGAVGYVQVFYSANGEAESTTEKVTTKSDNDFTHQFRLADLVPDTEYTFRVESTSLDAGSLPEAMVGKFRTAPLPSAPAVIRFAVSTCQAVRSIDAGASGHICYKNMLQFDPHFFVHTGDILYYDKAPLSKNVAEARAKWNLMFAYEHNQNFHLNVASYFMKDDHDTLKNDCWPGQRFGDLTFAEGLGIFREQVPMGESTFRTVRWGRDVQIWMTENRDFRSANDAPDGVAKTILGEEQKAWLKKTIEESDATFKFVISPGPIVGPDKKGKADNHSNEAFRHEGQELRDFLSQQENTYVICGDRHWQYCSKDPRTGLLEFGCGPINDEHRFGSDPGEQESHRYFSPKGGFLGITIEGDSARVDWFHVDQTDAPEEGGSELEILHTEQLPSSAGK